MKTISFYIVLFLMSAGMTYLFTAPKTFEELYIEKTYGADYLQRLPAGARDYILSEEFPQSLIIPLNKLSQKEFNQLVNDLNTSQRIDKQNIIIEAIIKPATHE